MTARGWRRAVRRREPSLPGLLAATAERGLEVSGADVRVPTLDDVFLGPDRARVCAREAERPRRTQHERADTATALSRPTRRARSLVHRHLARVRPARCLVRGPRAVLGGLLAWSSRWCSWPCSGRCSPGRSTGRLGGASVQWFVPGVLVMTTLFGTSITGSNLLFEMQTGSHERLLVTPLSRSSHAGRALAQGDGAAGRPGRSWSSW